MEAYYISFKERRPITEEARFNIDYFKADFSNIAEQFQICDWESFTIPLDPYFSELVRESYASYRARKDLLKHRDQ
ncbi:hypothetical protein HAX54_043575, partial [Datura stramonium]|nr:hypothetical protein [Datura stramonium]